MPVEQFKHDLIRWKIALPCHLLQHLHVLHIIKIVVILPGVKKGVLTHPERLMHLEIKANAHHIFLPLDFSASFF